MSNPRLQRSGQRRRQRLHDCLVFSLGLAAGLAIIVGGWLGTRWWQSGQLVANPAQQLVRAYFSELASGQFGRAADFAEGPALSALRFNVAHKRLSKVSVLDLRTVPEEQAKGAVLDAVAAETGGDLPTVARYQVLALYTTSGWRVADVWQGGAPATFGGTATSMGMLATAKDWLAHVSSGDFRASLHDLADGALTSAEQTGQSSSAWAKHVKVGTASWRVLGSDGAWGAVEGKWLAVTPAGTTNVDLVLLGQMVDGSWRITRVVTIN